MSIITNKFKTSNAATFKQDFIDSDYYIFVSSTQITQTNDSEYSINEFLENTLFGKKIDPDEVFFMINDYRWQSGLIYDKYDDRSDLSEKKFYAIVYPTDNSTGDYKVYKCLSNNHGAKSFNPPNYDADTDDQIYRMGDGYVWKFMYTISTVEYQKYSALQYFPITYPTAVITNVVSTGTAITYFADNNFKPGMVVTIKGIIPTQYNVTDRVITAASTTSFTISGDETGSYNILSQGVAVVKNGAIDNRSIDHIEVENYDLNKGYEVRSGTIDGVENNKITISGTDLNFLSNYYTGQTFYAKNQANNTANTYTIDTYTYYESDKNAVITLLDKDSFIEVNFNFDIFPKIEIKGDGTGAEAIPRINNLGTIENILVLNKGSGYTRATARVIRPLYGFDTASALSTDVEAVLRPILSPKNGHGYNFETELLSRRAHVYTSLSDTDNISIPSSNVYTKIGIVKNPEFTANTDLFDNRLKLTLSSSILTVGETVTQNYQVPISFSAEVHEVAGNVAYLCNYHGPYRTYPTANSSAEGYEDIPINIKSSIISSQNQILNINNTIRPNYIQKTGDVCYVTNFVPITRTTTSNEEYKIVLEF